MRPEIVTTKDGSHTLYLEALDEHYHSVHGAVQESRHVFIEAGLYYLRQPEVNILEVGMGTGLNCFMTLIQAHRRSLKVNYTTLEPYPLAYGQAVKLNYVDELRARMYDGLFHQIHRSVWGSHFRMTERFSLEKRMETVQAFKPDRVYDLIYFDAFAPSAQPELWEEAVIQKMADCLRPGGLLVTYCAKGSFKRALKNAGFEVEAIPGPPGKREMTRAIKH